MKNIIEKENAHTCKGKCGHHVGKAVIGGGVLFILGLTIWNTLQINTIYSASLAQYGNTTNLKTFLEITKSPTYLTNVANQFNQMKQQLGETEETTTDEGKEGSAEASTTVVNTEVTNGDQKWEANAKEAYTYFEMQGTPANAVINIKTGNFKAIAGAYPQSQFEEAIATLKKGAATTDQAGKAGTLTQEQLASLLKNARYYANEGAEIVIVEYTDLLCPFCQRHFNNKTLENIIAADKDVALVIKNMPLAQLHPTAPLGAKGAECAAELGGSKAYYDYIAKAFSYSTFNNDNVVEIATSIGLDKAAFNACYTK